MKAIVTIKADDESIMSQFEVQPMQIDDDVRFTNYVYQFVYSIHNMEKGQSIPYTETHRVTAEDVKLAYNRGYMEGMKRGRLDL